MSLVSGNADIIRVSDLETNFTANRIKQGQFAETNDTDKLVKRNLTTGQYNFTSNDNQQSLKDRNENLNSVKTFDKSPLISGINKLFINSATTGGQLGHDGSDLLLKNDAVGDLVLDTLSGTILARKNIVLSAASIITKEANDEVQIISGGTGFPLGATIRMTGSTTAGESNRINFYADSTWLFQQDIALGAFFNTNLTIGGGATGVDYSLTFDGETNDGVITWMEDEDYFKFSDDVLISGTEKLFINSATDGGELGHDGNDLLLQNNAGTGGLKIYNNGSGDLTLETGSGDIKFNANSSTSVLTVTTSQVIIAAGKDLAFTGTSDIASDVLIQGANSLYLSSRTAGGQLTYSSNILNITNDDVGGNGIVLDTGSGEIIFKINGSSKLTVGPTVSTIASGSDLRLGTTKISTVKPIDGYIKIIDAAGTSIYLATVNIA